MAKTRPGIERITKQELTAQKTALELLIHGHDKHCARCKQAGKNYAARCNTWWVYARKLHRLKRKLKAYDQPDTRNMSPLPGL